VKKIVKIGPHLPKLLSNTKQLTFLEHGIDSARSPLFIQARHKYRDRQTDRRTDGKVISVAERNTLHSLKRLHHCQNDIVMKLTEQKGNGSEIMPLDSTGGSTL